MKIMLTTLSPRLDSDIDPRFGRGAYLVLLDTDTMKWEAHPNPGLNATGGAGIQAAQFAANQKAEAILSGDFGPHAFNTLQAAEIAMYVYGDCQTADEAIKRFKAGKLERVGAATRGECDDGHHG
jgi:predicted Fe-Mo cluster-binding NifX family protein